ncbi:MAG: FkbM family methyltransferase [Promethearchaeota archaeon]
MKSIFKLKVNQNSDSVPLGDKGVIGERDDILSPKVAAPHEVYEHLQRYKYASKRCKGRILDLGCGTGYGTKTLFDKGNEVYGADISKNAIQYAEKNYKGPKYICCSAEKLPFVDNNFDVVIAFEVIEHVRDSEKALNEIYRVLKEGGELFISTPNPQHFGNLLRRLFLNRPYPSKIDTGNIYHIKEFNYNEFVSFIIRKNFKLVSEFGQHLPLIPGKVFGRRMPYKLPFIYTIQTLIGFPFPKFARTIVIHAKKTKDRNEEIISLKVKNRITDLKYLSWLLKHFIVLKFSYLISFFLFWILYSTPRLILGEARAINTSRNIIRYFMNGNFIIPLPIENSNIYYIGIRDIADFIIFREVCINDQYNYSQLKPGITIVDIGAHIGTFTLSAGLKIGEKGKIIAIEPEAKNFNQLIKNLELNKIENVVPVNIAISDFNGKANLFIDIGSQGHSLLYQDSSIYQVPVGVKTLDALLQELSIDNVDLLKIDAEGAELNILKGAKKTLIKNPKMKMLIAAYHYPQETSEVVKYLKELKFSPKISSGFVLVE